MDEKIDAELAVVGSCLKDPAAYLLIAGKLDSPRYFTNKALAIIWQAIIEVSKTHSACDPTILSIHLEKLKLLDQVGGRSYLIELIDGVASTANIESYVKILINQYVTREIVLAANKAINMAQDETDAADIIAYLDKSITELSKDYCGTGFVKLADILPETMARMDAISRGDIKGVYTGFTDIDAKIGWLEKGDLMVIAGLESSGKTSLALNMAENIAIGQQIPVGIFTIEGTKEKTAARFLCSHARISYLNIKNKKMHVDDWTNLVKASETLTPIPIHIDDTSVITPLEIKAKIAMMNQKEGVQVFVIDYLQKITARAESRRLEVTKIIQSLKATAEDLGVIVIVISSAVRTVEARKKGEDEIQTKESGDIDFEADIILKLWRKDKSARQAKLLIDKARNGETGMVELTFLPEYTKFENFTAFKEPVREIGDVYGQF